MKKKMKRTLTAILCLCCLLGLAACGEQEVEKSKYQQALDAIKAEDYESAYTLLKESTDRRAAEELEKFVFVPVRYTQRSSLEEETVYTLTYDAGGRLLTKKIVDKDSERVHEFTYAGDKLLSHRFRSPNGGYGEDHTYDSAGNLVLLQHVDNNGDWVERVTYTYDENNRCLTEESIRKENAQDPNPQLDHINEYTYDTEGRVLIDQYTDYYDGEVCGSIVTRYVYEPDGAYCEITTIDEGDPQYLRTNTEYYDAQGRVVRGQSQFGNENEPYVEYEYRYNQRGDKEYAYRREYEVEQVTLYTYDDEGHLLKEETTDPEGELMSIECNTYDDRGNRLTYEVSSLTDNYWRKEEYTYDQENHLLTEKLRYDSGWEDTTYTYDEQGNKIREDQENNYGSLWRTYDYDQWGNVIDYFQYYIYDGETAHEKTIQWELRYYPHEIPEEVLDAMAAAAVT